MRCTPLQWAFMRLQLQDLGVYPTTIGDPEAETADLRMAAQAHRPGSVMAWICRVKLSKTNPSLTAEEYRWLGWLHRLPRLIAELAEDGDAVPRAEVDGAFVGWRLTFGGT